jgi:hypothetical protein
MVTEAPLCPRLAALRPNEHLFIAGLEGRPHFFDLSMHPLRSAVGLPELKKRSPSIGDEQAPETLPSWAVKAVV